MKTQPINVLLLWELSCDHLATWFRNWFPTNTIISPNLWAAQTRSGTSSSNLSCLLLNAQLEYIHNLGGIAFYISIFSLIILAQVISGFHYRTWGFLVYNSNISNANICSQTNNSSRISGGSTRRRPPASPVNPWTRPRTDKNTNLYCRIASKPALGAFSIPREHNPANQKSGVARCDNRSLSEKSNCWFTSTKESNFCGWLIGRFPVFTFLAK